MAAGTTGKDAGSGINDENDATDEQDPETPAALLPQASRLQVAEYVAELTRELAKMARNSELDTIAYLLDIVRLEADTTVRTLLRLTDLG